MKLHSILLSTLLCTSVFALDGEMLALNDTKLYTLEELMEMTITTIATGTPLEEKFVPGSITVITAKQMKENGARTFQQALEQVPGVHIYPGKSFAMKKGISIRGIQTNTNPHVLIMLDGISLGSANYGSPVFPFNMPTSIIEKIEIIRGPGSALYGADAFSGVINIISKKHETIENQAGARYGSFYTVEGFTQVKTEIGELKIGLAASLVDTDGDNGRRIQEDSLGSSAPSLAPGPLNSQYNTTYVHADLHYKEFDLNMMFSNTNDSGTHSWASQSLDPDGKVENETYLLDLKHTNKTWLKDTTIKTDISFTSYDILADYNVVPGVVRVTPGFSEDIYAFNTRFIYSGIDNHLATFGIGYKHSSIRDITHKFNNTELPANANFIDEVSRRNYYGFIQDEYKINDSLNLVAGLRYDDYDDFGGTTNPRISLIWQQSDDLTIKTMYGRAFRAPAFNELYLKNNALSLGNPDLDPETIDTYEVIFEYRAPLYTKLNLYYYEAQDLITYVDDPGATSKSAQNQAAINAYGLELDLSYNINEKVNLSGNYAFVHAEYDDTKRKVEDIVPHQVFAQLEYKPANDWNVNTQFFYFSKRERLETDTRDKLDADTLVNLSVTKNNLIKNLDAVVAVRNLFDSDYREPSDGKIAEDYPMEGFNIFAELTYKF